MIRYFAPRIIDLLGNEHLMAIAEQKYPGGEVTFSPFTHEIHSTRFIGKRIRLFLTDEGLLAATPW